MRWHEPIWDFGFGIEANCMNGDVEIFVDDEINEKEWLEFASENEVF
jgi:hypothetical protein